MQNQEKIRKNPVEFQIQKLLGMEERELFAESVMFLFRQIMGVAEGNISPTEYHKSKTFVDGIFQARKLAPYFNKPLPKYPERGWLFPYLYEGSCRCDRRWEWWSNCLLAENVEGPIPQIDFHLHSFDKEVQETIRHIEDILKKLESMIGVSSSLMTLVSWLLWGLGSRSIEEQRCPEKAGEYLYKTFELGLIQAAPFDYLAWFAQQTRGKGRWGNPTNFYPTPHPVSEAMAKMLFDGIDGITQSLIDPCAGTGTLLLFASNYSVNLHGAEIAWDLVRMCELNGYLYIPWLVRPAPWLAPEKPDIADQVDADTQQEQPTQDRKRVIVGKKYIEFQEKNEQLTFFEM